MTWRERERAFFIGAPLAIIPALGFLPTVIFLIIAPIIAHGTLLAAFLLPIFLVIGCFGLWKLAVSAVEKPFNVLNVLSFGALLVLLIIASYTGLFLALISVKI
jgi:hypothetical protein